MTADLPLYDRPEVGIEDLSMIQPVPSQKIFGIILLTSGE